MARLSVSGYNDAGRVSGAIARLADDAWEAMPDVMRAAARLVLLRLVRPDDGAGTEIRLRASPRDVAPTTAAAEALGRMVERRLLTLGDGTVEITHEALLREWPRLAGWLAEDVEGRRLHHRLTAAAALWEHGGGDDGDLFRGVRLAATNEWLSSGHESELNDTERRFIAASIAGADRELEAARREARRQSQMNRKLRIRLAAIAVLLTGAIGTGSARRTPSRPRRRSGGSSGSSEPARRRRTPRRPVRPGARPRPVIAARRAGAFQWPTRRRPGARCLARCSGVPRRSG